MKDVICSTSCLDNNQAIQPESFILSRLVNGALSVPFLASSHAMQGKLAKLLECLYCEPNLLRPANDAKEDARSSESGGRSTWINPDSFVIE
jgi:hypothetical protein